MSHTIYPGFVPAGYFDDENITFIQNKLTQEMTRWFTNPVRFDRRSVVWVMDKILNERIETIPKMNQRVIMEISNNFKVYQLERNKHMRWESVFPQSQRLYDELSGKSNFDMGWIKDNTTVRRSAIQPGGVRFYFT